jgi:glycosyltransferase involved in cell wall biosynthesis
MNTDAQSLMVLSPYGHLAPSTRVRLYDWLDYLGLSAFRSGYAGLANNSLRSITTHSAMVIEAERRTRSMVSHVSRSVVLLSREASPWSHGGLESRLLRNAGRGVYDLDDALFADRNGWRKVLGKEPKCRRSIEAADQVVVGNEYLAAYAEQHASNIAIIPSCVDPASYLPKRSYDLSDEPRLVWLGSLSTERYVVDIAPALREVYRRTGARLTMISGARTDEHPELDGLVDRVLWSKDDTPKLLAAADVAIGPLSDNEFSRGKCAYKLLQYAATGLPMVGSPVGANRLALSRFHGLAASSTDEWVDGLLSMLEVSADARRRRGEAASASVQAHYSFQAWADDWKKVVGV